MDDSRAIPLGRSPYTKTAERCAMPVNESEEDTMRFRSWTLGISTITLGAFALAHACGGDDTSPPPASGGTAGAAGAGGGAGATRAGGGRRPPGAAREGRGGGRARGSARTRGDAVRGR